MNVINKCRTLSVFLVILLAFSQTVFADNKQTNEATVNKHIAEREIEEVDLSLLQKYMKDHSVLALIDARTAKEFNAGHISGAVNIPFNQLDDFYKRLPSEQSTSILVYCKSGRRAQKLVNLLMEKGYTDVKAIPGKQLNYQEDKVGFLNVD
ncbi:rhodanese-like domain-containing protein [Microbulbifer sp. EKSA008]|uniref:rhodanese-like domain-containing protein n=1 Tax=Microbulbifer sp. EKSA008 TaxID=3243367 RepID=UPI004042CCA4